MPLPLAQIYRFWPAVLPPLPSAKVKPGLAYRCGDSSLPLHLAALSTMVQTYPPPPAMENDWA